MSDVCPRLWELVADLVHHIHASARLAEFGKAPDGRYALRVNIPREPGKYLFLFPGLINQALTKPEARRLLRNILHAEILQRGALRTISDSRRVRFEHGSPACGVCAGPILAGGDVVFYFGVMAHRACARYRREA